MTVRICDVTVRTWDVNVRINYERFRCCGYHHFPTLIKEKMLSHSDNRLNLLTFICMMYLQATD